MAAVAEGRTSSTRPKELQHYCCSSRTCVFVVVLIEKVKYFDVSYHDSGKNTREDRVLERSMIPVDTACGIALVLALQKSTVVQSSFHEKNLSIKLQMLLDCNLSDSSAPVSIYT